MGIERPEFANIPMIHDGLEPGESSPDGVSSRPVVGQRPSARPGEEAAGAPPGSTTEHLSVRAAEALATARAASSLRSANLGAQAKPLEDDVLTRLEELVALLRPAEAATADVIPLDRARRRER